MITVWAASGVDSWGDFGDTAIASVLTALIAGVVAYATSRSARKGQEAQATAAAEAAVANQTLTSRTDIEKEAFERARGYYTDAIDRQAAEIGRQANEIAMLEVSEAGLKERIQLVEHDKAQQRQQISQLESRVDNLEKEKEQLKERLRVATQLLGHKYPDE